MARRVAIVRTHGVILQALNALKWANLRYLVYVPKPPVVGRRGCGRPASFAHFFRMLYVC